MLLLVPPVVLNDSLAPSVIVSPTDVPTVAVPPNPAGANEAVADADAVTVVAID